jgi:hypothetical protein
MRDSPLAVVARLDRAIQAPAAAIDASLWIPRTADARPEDDG